MKEYSKEKQVPLKCLQVMDNVTARPQDLDDDIPDGFDSIKVKFIPPNTTSLLQLMNKQVISNIKSSVREHSPESALM